MDKYEYRVKTEQMQEYMEKKQYKKAMEIADTIDWRRVKNVATLNSVSEIYEYNGEYQKSRDILFVAFDRSPGSRKIAYRLGLLALKINDIEEAADCYEEFVKLAPKDPNQYILKYRILSAQGAPLSEQIAALEEFKKAEYIEKWAYELARLYHEAGMTAECLEECDDLILWFSEGKYVYQAMELKMQYKPLTPLQQEKYDAWPGASKKPRPIKRNTSAKMPVSLEEEKKEKAPIRQEETKAQAGAKGNIANTLEIGDAADEQRAPAVASENSSIKKVVKGATLQEALANGMAFANGMRSVEKTVAKVKEGIRQVTGQIHMESLINGKKDEEQGKEEVSKEETLEIEEPEVQQAEEPKRTERTARIRTDRKTSALRATGQMRIEEILQEWEAKQRVNAEAIERQREEDDERLRRERDEIGLQRELERLEAQRMAKEEEASREESEENAVKKLEEKEALKRAAKRKEEEEKEAAKQAELKAAQARKAAAEEALRKAEEAARKAEEEAAARKAAAEEMVRKAEEEARKITEEALRKAKEIVARKAEEAQDTEGESEAADEAEAVVGKTLETKAGAEDGKASETRAEADKASAAKAQAGTGKASAAKTQAGTGKASETRTKADKTVEDAEEIPNIEEMLDSIPDIDFMVEEESESLEEASGSKKRKGKVKQTTKKTVAADRAEEKKGSLEGKTQRIPDDIVRLMEELGEDSSETDEDTADEELGEELLSKLVENRSQSQSSEEEFEEVSLEESEEEGFEEEFEEAEFEEEFEGEEFEEKIEKSKTRKDLGENDFEEDFEENDLDKSSLKENKLKEDNLEENDMEEDSEAEGEEDLEVEEIEEAESEEDFEVEEIEGAESEEDFEEESFEEKLEDEEFGEDFEEGDFEEGFEEEFEEGDFEEGFEEEFEEGDLEEEFEEEEFEEGDFEEEFEEGDYEEGFEEEGFEEEYEESYEAEAGEELEEDYEEESEEEFEEEFEEDYEEDYIEEEFEEEGFGEEDFEEEEFEEEELEEEEFEEEDLEEDEFESEDYEEELEIEEPSEEEIQARFKKAKGSGVPFDTGFVVTGRYDLNATSEIGLKAGLTEEQKKLFSYFVPVRGMSEQLVEVLDNDRRARKEGTSKTGNLLVIGRKGSGKTVLAVDIVKAIQKQRNLKQGKVAIVTGESLNKKELTNIIQKLRGGAIIVEKAGKLNSRTIKELNHLMEKKTGEMLFVLEDQRKPLERILTANPEFKKKFTSKLELPIFVNDELVTFGQTYAKENGYKLDEMGILALYSRIDVMQREDHAVSVAEVKDIMDEAIEHSQKANVKHLARRVFGRGTDESDRIILKEEDFKI